uniref:Factor of DNA methylation 1-5/IDN2 domain-containing protein n=1 Tax=Leersia perrieri TaxID=77586 RepID=A0A0D9VW21_9ORYZ
MDHSSGEESYVSDSDIGVYEDKTFNQLKAGKLKVKHGNKTFRCPFCPGKKKQDYNLKDLLQHASGIGAASKRKVKVRATHLALARYLKVDLAGSLESPLQLAMVEYKPPENEEKYVWPWMGILVNLPTELKEKGSVGEAEERLRAEFSRFRPRQVIILWNSNEQVGYAIIKFSENWNGLKDTLAFEKHFNVEKYGKMDWNKRNCRRDDIYGWVARTDDYNSLGPTGEYLRKNGELKGVCDLEHEGHQRTGRRVDYFARKIEEKNKHLEELMFMNNQNGMKLHRIMEENNQLVEEHNKNIKELQKDAFQDSKRIRSENLKLYAELQTKKHEIDQRCKELDYLSTKTNVDRAKLITEKLKNAKENDLLNLANLKQKKADEELLRLVEKHKREKEDALKKQFELEKKLDSKQKLELEREQLKGKLEVMKQMGSEEDATLKKKFNELREQLEEMESMKSLNEALVMKDKRANDELEDAKKELIIGFETTAGAGSNIGVKKVGTLDETAFYNACKKKMPKCDLRAKPALCSKWQDELRKPGWYPFNVIETDGQKKKKINEDDEKLHALRMEFGDEAYNVVVKALVEMNEYNPSGNVRFPIPELWNFKENRIAPIPEVVGYMVKQWKTHKNKKT